MNKIAIVGSAGAGKSTLARKLGAILDIPVTHLDVLFWRPGWVEPPREEWAALQRKLVRGERWILDGNYGGTIDLRLDAADTVVFLDLPRSICIWRVLKRRMQYARRRPDLAPGCPESIDWPFLQWIWSYPRQRRPQMLARFARLDETVTVVVLRSQREIQRWLDNLETANDRRSDAQDREA